MKIAAIIPTRDDRPALLHNCLRMMENQSVKIDIEIVDDKPISDQKDITWRYRTGYDRLREKGYDLIFLIENDDWYHPDYIKTMMFEWQRAGCPDLFGTAYTVYYHLKLKAWFTMKHKRRASAMNTVIRPDMTFSWCADHDPYTDLHLWRTIPGVTWEPWKLISMGMKHGVGVCGGRNHIDRMERYINQDTDLSYLRQHLDPASFQFYSRYFE